MTLNVKFLGCVLSFYLVTALYAFFYILRTHNSAQFHQQHPDIEDKNTLLIPVSSRQFIQTKSLGDGAALFVETEEERRYWDQWAPSNDPALHNSSLLHVIKSAFQTQPKYTVDIWSNNGLGIYLWEHILQGEIKPVEDVIYKHGEKTIGDVKYRYKGGEKLNVAFLPDASDNVILVLNGRDNVTSSTARSWLDGLVYLELLQNVGVVLIGDEFCNNDWILLYLHQKNVTSPKFVFIVYDCPCVDDELIHQFPLGVATYRNFPLASYPELSVPGVRRYTCNFMGTVYDNSSRLTLVNVISSINKRYNKELCFLKARQTWLAEETHEGLQSYLQILKSSDLTLCPVGKNSESYRIYEAMSVGSVPVIEDLSASQSCNTQPFRLLKRYKAPVIYIKSWTELETLLNKEEKMSKQDKERRREIILTWYNKFRRNIAQLFTKQVESKFFGL